MSKMLDETYPSLKEVGDISPKSIIELQEQRKKEAYDRGFNDAVDKIDTKLDMWCVHYMADCNSDLEFNRRSPPIWEYLRQKLNSLKKQ